MTHHRYKLYKVNGKFYLLSNTSARIMEALLKEGVDKLTYQELVESSGAKLCSLYVFCQRLADKKLIKRVKIRIKGTKQKNTYIRALANIQEIELYLVK